MNAKPDPSLPRAAEVLLERFESRKATIGVIGMGEPAWPRWTMFAISGLLGIGYAAVDLMPWAMIGEVVDENELSSGQRSQGVYNGVLTFLRKAGGATAYMVAGFALSLAGYDRDAAQQSPMVMDTVRLLTTAAPAPTASIPRAPPVHVWLSDPSRVFPGRPNRSRWTWWEMPLPGLEK